MRYYIVVGEASGDLHASNLMRGIKEKDPNAEFRYFGGDLMQAQGGTLVKHYRDMAFMGFLEVLLNLRTIAGNMKRCKADIREFNPDALILVDYPGFNLRIAEYAKQQGVRVFYYIAPKVWAWREGRVKALRQFVDKLFVIFPFEVGYFRKHGIDPVYEGNPSLDAIAQGVADAPPFDRFVEQNGLNGKPIIALVAGSRRQEVRHNLPAMLQMERRFPDFQLVIAGAPSLTPEVYAPYLAGRDVRLVFGQTYALLKHSSLAFVTSGTATLEAALINVPQVVCYRGNLLSMLIAWAVIRVRYISLVNLNMDAEVVKELKQYDLTPNSLYNEAIKLVQGTDERKAMLNSYAALRQMLGEEGASRRVGARMVELITK